MNYFLITLPGLLNYFLALGVIILTESHFSQLISYIHDLWRRFVFCMVK